MDMEQVKAIILKSGSDMQRIVDSWEKIQTIWNKIEPEELWRLADLGSFCYRQWGISSELLTEEIVTEQVDKVANTIEFLAEDWMETYQDLPDLKQPVTKKEFWEAVVNGI